MKIGLDGSRAFIGQRTGIEEYSYRVIKNLREHFREEEVFLYLREKQKVDFSIPKNWKIKIIKWPRFWTQIGLSWEMFFHPVDILFIPAHTVPLVHPKKTFVTIHGLEYEACPKAYSFLAKIYMRWSIRFSCLWAKKIIAVSENTKKDLTRWYHVAESKIRVVYEGYEKNDLYIKNRNQTRHKMNVARNKPYFLFVGRLEERKNIIGIVLAFEILKKRYGITYKLVLAGKFGFGEEKIKKTIETVICAKDIILTGFVSEEEKWELFQGADAFLFPTFYEGFGLPILEAQSISVPVVTSNISSLPEVAGGAAILVDPKNSEDIADAIHSLIADKKLREEMIKRGHANTEKFSWKKCARETATILKN